MKYTLMFLMLVSLAHAGTITVDKGVGKQQTYSTDDYVVVKKRKGPVVKKPPHVCPVPEVREKEVIVTKEVIKTVEPKKNEVKLLGGVGPSGYETELLPTSFHMSQGYQATFGLGYERHLTEEWSLEAIACTNETALLGVGYSF